MLCVFSDFCHVVEKQKKIHVGSVYAACTLTASALGVLSCLDGRLPYVIRLKDLFFLSYTRIVGQSDNITITQHPTPLGMA